MHYLGKEKEIKIAVERPIEYIRCDRCNTKILPRDFRGVGGHYVHIHTWHNDWGNDSMESHESSDYCVPCAKEVVAEYVENIVGSQELELTSLYLTSSSVYRGPISTYEGYVLVSDDPNNIVDQC